MSAALPILRLLLGDDRSVVGAVLGNERSVHHAGRAAIGLRRQRVVAVADLERCLRVRGARNGRSIGRRLGHNGLIAGACLRDERRVGIACQRIRHHLVGQSDVLHARLKGEGIVDSDGGSRRVLLRGDRRVLAAVLKRTLRVRSIGLSDDS